MSDGFLGRWSRRKLDANEGKPLPPEPPDLAAPESGPAPDALPNDPVAAGQAPDALPTTALDASQPAEPPLPEPPPTLDDVKALTAQSDFSRFAARDVAPEVKNAAMKKLFADPRYNVMDGMDVYIDDYSKPDPIPESMLRQLAGAAFLRLFDEPPAQPAAAGAQARDVADNPAAQSVAQSAVPAAVPEPDHADPDMRLQPDDAAAGPDPGPGTV